MTRSTSSTSLLYISDTHVGSNYAISTPNPIISQDMTERKYNQRQEKIHTGWLKCCDLIKQPNKIKACFLAGDLTEGTNNKKPGKDLWTMDPVDMAYDVNRLLMPIASKAERIFVERGSDYHVSPDRSVLNYDEMVAQFINADSYETTFVNQLEQLNKKPTVRDASIMLQQIKKTGTVKNKNNQLLDKFNKEDNIIKRTYQLEKEVGNIPEPKSGIKFKGLFDGWLALTVRHDVAFSPNYMYRGTGLTRNDMIMTLQKERLFPQGYEMIINAYGHVHYYHVSGNDTHYNFTIPCWKSSDSYLKAKGIVEPDFGIVEIIIEPNHEIIMYPYTLRGSDYPVEQPYIL
jgi:hypothetical protein